MKIPWRRAWQPTPVFLPGESPWTEKSGGPQSIGSERAGHDWGPTHPSILANVEDCKEMEIQSLDGDHLLKEEMATPCSLENPMDSGAWWTTVHRVTQSRTRLKQLSRSTWMSEKHLKKKRQLYNYRLTMDRFLLLAYPYFLSDLQRTPFF